MEWQPSIILVTIPTPIRSHDRAEYPTCKVLLVKASDWLRQLGMFMETEQGVARFLGGQRAATTSSLSLDMRYLRFDAVLGEL